MGRPRRGLEDFDRAIRRDPALTVAYHNRGLAHRELGDLTRAINDFGAATRLESLNNLSRYARAVTALNRAARRGAVGCLNRDDGHRCWFGSQTVCDRSTSPTPHSRMVTRTASNTAPTSRPSRHRGVET